MFSNFQIKNKNAVRTACRGSHDAARYSLVFGVNEIGIACSCVSKIEHKTFGKALIHSGFGTDVQTGMYRQGARQFCAQYLKIAVNGVPVGRWNVVAETEKDTMTDHEQKLSLSSMRTDGMVN
ncbi:hypothetical protein BLM14_14505 [Phyllobacterium zundukense]|nr:hypothetical protein BLM14_14505 [Phyllobacterium zundukense]